MSTKNFSQECFYVALISLSNSCDINEINIKQICKKAGYNRSTFYRHFSSKEDIVIQKVNNLIINWHSSLNLELGYEFENFVKLFEYFRVNSEAFVLMHKMNLDEELLRLSHQYLYTNFEVDEYDTTFINNGILAVIYRWVESGMNESNEFMAKLLLKYLTIDTMLNK